MTSIGENEIGELCQRLANALIADESSDLKPDYLREAISVCLSRAGLAIIPTDKLESLSEALNDGVATLMAVRATAGSDEWPESAKHFHDLCGETVKRMNAALALTPQKKDGDGE
jgi:hypothetical protein